MIWKFSISFNRAYKKFSDLKIKISSKKWNFKFPRTHVFVNVVIKVEVPFEICCSKISLRRKKNRRIINSDGELIIKILQNPSFPWWLQISRFLPVYNRLDFFFFFFFIEGSPSISKSLIYHSYYSYFATLHHEFILPWKEN